MRTILCASLTMQVEVLNITKWENWFTLYNYLQNILIWYLVWGRKEIYVTN